ncbi:MAG: DNA internalization-related competence protein ComEC/Rec2 [Firmicutes bacterium]|nr:DNA internalization-related competence protein ComEC/Rec2 [Bacillota bacterium]
MDRSGRLHLFGKKLAAAFRWLDQARACWLGNSTAARLVLWLAAGIILAKELVLPPYLTWMIAVLWWGLTSIRLLLAGRKLRQAAIMVLVALTGAAGFSSYWYAVETGLAYLAEAEGPVLVLAQVLKTASDNPSRQRLTVEIKGVMVPEGIRLQRGRAVVTHAAEDDELDEYRPGEAILVGAQFRRPRRASNPGQFDYAHYLYRRGISLTAFVEGKEAIRRLERHESLLQAALSKETFPWKRVSGMGLIYRADRLRHRLLRVWEDSLPSRYQGLLAAMVFGDDTGLEEDLEQAFRRTGQAHLLSVSGLHVGFVAGWVWYLGRFLPGCQVVKYLVGMLAAWGYALLAGGNPPVVRAAAALSLYLGAAALGRGHDRQAAACWAAFLQLWVNPSLLFDISFQLSYGALLGILVLAKPLETWLFPKEAQGGPLAGIIANAAAPMVISISAQLAIFPFLSYYFQEISLLGPFIGLIAVPTAGLVVPLALLGSLVGLVFAVQGWLALILLVLLTILDELLCLCSTWSWAVFYSGAGSVLLWTVYYFALTVLVQYLKEGTVYRWLGFSGASWWRNQRRNVLFAVLLAAVWMVYMPILAPLWRPLEITFLDVGQGDAVFISTPSGRNLLIDGGGLPSSLSDAAFDVGERIVLPFLKHRGVRWLDLVVATHFHNDHTQGLGAVLRELPVALLGDNGLLDTGFASRQYRDLLRELEAKKDIPRITLRRGQWFDLSRGMELVVIHPGAEADEGLSDKGVMAAFDQNNNSVVLKLRTPHYSALFTGDIDREAQMELVQRHINLGSLKTAAGDGENNGGNDVGRDQTAGSLQERFGLSADILKVPHHGARRALVYSFLGAVSPSLGVISVGNNPHGHPASEVLQALELVTAGTPLRTDVMGSITLRIWGKRMVIDTFHAPSPWELGRWPLVQQWELRFKNLMPRV